MEKIKFRVWDKKCSKWTIAPLNECVVADINCSSELIWCPFTGKYDINDKEIYEGDIVRFKRCNEYFIGEIAYIDEHGAYFVIHSGLSDNQLYAYFNYEVIGNIYENPELLADDDE